MMKIAVCVPHYGDVKARFVLSLGALLVRTTAAISPEIRLFFEEDGPLELKRTLLALKSGAWGADFQLWIDTDQTFPSDGLLRLLSHNRPIVGGNYLTRHEPAWPTALDDHGRRLPTTKAKRRAGIVEGCGAIGLGFCLTDAKVFKKIPPPWFESKISAEGRLVRGEDVHFCNMAWRAGVPVAVDHGLAIGHIAERVVTLDGEDANAGSVLPAAGNQ
jgi:hypothetical protein